MNRTMIFAVALGLAVAAAAAYAWTAPRRAVAAIAELHEANPQLREHLDDYARTLHTLGAPARAVARLAEVRTAIETARTFKVEVRGSELRPWETIVGRFPGGEVLDGLVSGVAEVIEQAESASASTARLGVARGRYEASLATALSTPSRAHLRDVSDSAASLAFEVGTLRAPLASLAGDLDSVSHELSRSKAWVESVEPDSTFERTVIAGLSRGLGGAASVLDGPREQVAGLVAQMDADIELLDRVARLAGGPRR